MGTTSPITALPGLTYSEGKWDVQEATSTTVSNGSHAYIHNEQVPFHYQRAHDLLLLQNPDKHPVPQITEIPFIIRKEILTLGIFNFLG